MDIFVPSCLRGEAPVKTHRRLTTKEQRHKGEKDVFVPSCLRGEALVKTHRRPGLTSINALCVSVVVEVVSLGLAIRLTSPAQQSAHLFPPRRASGVLAAMVASEAGRDAEIDSEARGICREL